MKYFIVDGFEHPLYIILGIIFLICVFIIYWKYKPQENFVDIDLLQEVYRKRSFWYWIYLSSIIFISVFLLLVLSGPYKDGSKEKIKRNGIDIEIVFDVSYSMIAQDIKPSRIEGAKSVFLDFISALQNDRVGLILFAGKPFQSVPLSYDYDFLKDFIRDMSVETISQNNPNLQGTAIGDGLVLASDVLWKNDSQREKVIILITDGEANKWVKPELALKLLKEKGIKTYTIGVGKDQQTSIEVMVYPGMYQKMNIWAVDEKILKKIAKETGGKYFRADSRDTFSQIFDTISKLEKRELESEIYIFHKSMVHIFLLLILFCYIPLSYLVFFKKIRI